MSTEEPSWKSALLDKGKADQRFEPYVWNSIDCGDGWRPLVEAFYALVEKSPCMSVAQVKEKYAGLRLYWDHDETKCKHEKWVKDEGMQPAPDRHWDELHGIVDGICYASEFMCEECGNYGKIRGQGWYKTLCDKCEAEGK